MVDHPSDHLLKHVRNAAVGGGGYILFWSKATTFLNYGETVHGPRPPQFLVAKGNKV